MRSRSTTKSEVLRVRISYCIASELGNSRTFKARLKYLKAFNFNKSLSIVIAHQLVLSEFLKLSQGENENSCSLLTPQSALSILHQRSFPFDN